MANPARVVGGLLVAANSSVAALAIVSSRQLRSRIMFQTIANHAAIETVMGLLMVVAGLPQLLGVPAPPAFCGILFAAVPALVLASMMALACLTLERYVAVIHGLRYFQLMTLCRRRGLLLLPWLTTAAGAAFCSAVLLNVPSSSESCSIDDVPRVIFLVMDSVDLLLCLFIVAINTLVLLEAARHRGDIQRQMQQVNAAAAKYADKYHSYKAIIIVVGLYIAFLVPNDFASIIAFFSDSELSRNVKAVTIVLRRIMFIFDGWMFGFFCTEMRARYRQIFCCCCYKNKGSNDDAPLPSARRFRKLFRVSRYSARVEGVPNAGGPEQEEAGGRQTPGEG